MCAGSVGLTGVCTRGTSAAHHNASCKLRRWNLPETWNYTQKMAARKGSNLLYTSSRDHGTDSPRGHIQLASHSKNRGVVFCIMYIHSIAWAAPTTSQPATKLGAFHRTLGSWRWRVTNSGKFHSSDEGAIEPPAMPSCANRISYLDAFVALKIEFTIS